MAGRNANGYAIMTHDIENFREAHIYIYIEGSTSKNDRSEQNP